MPRATELPAVLDVARDVERWADDRDWVGTDPYEGLNATRVPSGLLRRELPRRLLMQAVKRSVVDLRPALGISATANPAALAWAASGYAIGGVLDEATEAHRLERLVARLLDLRAPGFDVPCWGYPWPFQSRVFRQPAGRPNTIATTYVAMAMLDAYERLGHRDLLDVAERTGWFFLRHVPQTAAPGGAYFGYWPDDRTPIHNANLHVCGLLARLWTFTHEPAFLDAAASGVGYALAHQREDGAWDYGDHDSLRWVDNFHTGYVLDSLAICAQAGVDARIDEALRRGLAFYREAMFLADGTPRYYDVATYPIDSQCVAQAIQTLALSGAREPENVELARLVYRFAVTSMRRPDGAFVFQRRRYWVNRAAHMRGTVASMFLALVHLLAAERTAAQQPAIARPGT